MNLFYFDPVIAVAGIVYMLIRAMIVGSLIGLIRYIVFAYLERHNFMRGGR